MHINQVENYEVEKKLLNENTCSLNSRLLDAQIIICDLQDDLVRLTVIENLVSWISSRSTSRIGILLVSF